VLVTGATGFIGKRLCRALADAGARVDAVSRGGRRPPGAARAFACDVADAKGVAELVAECRPAVVYHLAAHVTGSRDVGAVASTLGAKLLGGVNLLIATEEIEDCRVVLAGSLEEAGHGSSLAPVSPYAAASSALRSYAELFRTLYERDVVHARIGMVYGPGDPSETRLVPYVVRTLLAGRAPELGSGRRRVDWIHVDDVVAGLVALARMPEPGPGAVDLGSGELVSIRDVAERIATALGRPAPLRFGRRSDPLGEREWVADLAATRARVDWQPRIVLDEGLRSTIQAERAALEDQMKSSRSFDA
jgi:UDP-glucose 4-epimerase